MKTLNKNRKWDVSLKAVPGQTEPVSRPKIGDDDGVSNNAMNVVILVFMLLTAGLTIATAQPTVDAKYRILLCQAMLDIENLEYDEAVTKLLEVRANTDENANVNHMLGLCYLYGKAAPAKAVYYLNRAVKYASKDFQSCDLDQNKAPMETKYHLAKAYEEVSDYTKAALYYKAFLRHAKQPKGNASRTYAMITRNAQRCLNAAQHQADKVSFDNIVLTK